MTTENKAALRRVFWWGGYAVSAGVVLFLSFSFTTRRSPVSSAQFVPALQYTAASGIYTVVAGGDPSPLGGEFVSDGTPALGLGENALNDAGDIVFYSAVVDDSLPGGARPGIFRKAGKVISKIVAHGDPAPGGGEFLGFLPPAANQVGEVAFNAAVKVGPEEEDISQGVFLVAGGHIRLVAPLPKDPDIWQRISTSPALNNHGEVVMKLPVAGEKAGREVEIAKATNSGLSKVVGEGDFVPAPTQALPMISDGSPISVNDAGDLVLRVDGPRAKIVLVKSGQEPVILVTAGDPAPGGGTYLGVGLSKINNLGDVGFGGLIDVQQATPLGAITLVSKGQLTVIAREGDPAPTGGTFTVVGSVPPLLNDRGQIIFVAGTSGELTIGGLFPVSGGIFLYNKGQIRKIVSFGEPSPLGGVFLSAGPPVFNNTGTVAFNGIIDTDGDGNPNTQGIFAVNVQPGT